MMIGGKTSSPASTRPAQEGTHKSRKGLSRSECIGIQSPDGTLERLNSSMASSDQVETCDSTNEVEALLEQVLLNCSGVPNWCIVFVQMYVFVVYCSLRNYGTHSDI